MEKQRRRVSFQCVMHELGRLLRSLYWRLDADLHAGSIVGLGELKGQLQGGGVAFGFAGPGLQYFVRLPLALRCGDNRALHGGVAFLQETVHERHADEFVLVACLEHPRPGIIELGDDAFLDVCDRRTRVLHVVLQLFTVLGGRNQRIV